MASDPVVWVKAWKEDEDIRAFGIMEIQRHIRRYEKAIVAYKKYLSSLKGAKINM